MKEFYAHFISGYVSFFNLEQVSSRLDQFEKQKIDNLLWSSINNRPTVSFIAAYTYHSLLLKFNVKEKYNRAIYREINDPVYKDSCVEAFIAFDKAGYYNLEFNSLGTALVGYGSGKENRVYINKTLVEHINAHATSNPPNGNGFFEWELTLNIPFDVFEFHKIMSLEDKVCKANFYKCGDELPEPHYLSWSNILFPEPNFHLPDFFGEVKFIA